MSDLHIPGTQSTPAIQGDWQAGRLSMQGDSYPENSYELFGQVIDWVERFLADGQRPLELDLRLLYLNTSSIKAMMDILDLLEEAHQAVARSACAGTTTGATNGSPSWPRSSARTAASPSPSRPTTSSRR